MGRWNVGLPFLIWYSAQLRQQSYQLYTTATLHSQGSSSLLISIRGWVEPRATEGGQKEWMTWKFPWPYQESNLELPILWCTASTNCTIQPSNKHMQAWVISIGTVTKEMTHLNILSYRNKKWVPGLLLVPFFLFLTA